MATIKREKTRKNENFRECNKCNFICSYNSDWNRHTMARKHLMATTIFQENEKNEHFLECKICNFICSYNSDWDRHVLSRKHLMATKCYQKNEKNENYEKNECLCSCICGNIYKHKSSYYKHKKTCTFVNVCEAPLANTFVPADDNMRHNHQTNIYVPPPSTDNNIIFELLKQNQDLKDLMVEQNKNVLEQNKNVLEQNKTIIDLASKVGNTTNITTTQNNQFNLQLFLNETCKEAMSINEFVDNLPVTFQQLENIEKNGYVAGITEVIITQLNKIDINLRPLHCTDVKRDIMFIKEKNAWVKDDANNNRMKQILRCVAKNNLKHIYNWSEKNPNSKILDTKENIFCMSAMLKSLGVNGDAQDKLDSRAIKNIAKFVHLERCVA